MGEIARENNIAVGSVYNYLKHYNIETRKKATPEQFERIAKKNRGKPSKLKGTKKSKEICEKISKARKGDFRNPTAFGGHFKIRNGYRYIYNPTHPNASKDGYVMEHTLAMEKRIGRYLKDYEVVHHINKIRTDNRIENLQLMSFKEHASLHLRARHAVERALKLRDKNNRKESD
jgi:hypothetical protein